MEAKRCGNVYKLKTVGDEVCHAATTSRKEPWAVVHARLGHIPSKRYEQLLTMADGVPRIADAPSDHVCTGCCMDKIREDNFSRNLEKTVKSAGVLDLIHSDVMGPMQTKPPGGCTYAVTFIDDFSHHVTVYFMKKRAEVLEKFNMFKADMDNATGRKIKRIRSDNGGEYTGRIFKEYLSKQGNRHEKTVSYTPQQNGLAECMNRSLVEMARCMLNYEGIGKKWWAEAVNTAAWIINRIPNTVTVKTPYEIVYQKKPQLKNLKVFGALDYGHIPDEKRRKLDAKTFKCRFVGYEDGVKGYRVPNMGTGQVKILRTVKFMEITSMGDFMTEVEGDDKDENVAAPHATAPSHGQSQTLTIFNDEVVPRQHEVTTETAIVPAPSHSVIIRSRTRHIEETTDPEEAEGRKKQIVAPFAIGTKRQKVSQARIKPRDELLATEGGQLMAATEEVPKTYAEATTRQDQDEWKKAIASELKSLIVNKTWKLVPKPAHQRPIGCRWVFALKRDEKGQVIRYKARRGTRSATASTMKKRIRRWLTSTRSVPCLRNAAQKEWRSSSAMSIQRSCMGSWKKRSTWSCRKDSGSYWNWPKPKERTTSSACCPRVCMDSSRHCVFGMRRSTSTSRVWDSSLLTPTHASTREARVKMNA
ncbi:hypothetical protein PF006_g13558 [Phytophthora fragariae]|nr:hypothetical protein PF003_g11282 [Phytophthora fragariae]KAE8932419.1 hypothetical protein PF009_g17550 [Phytophthora fragariae]KAE9140316.1 hypothetical protein PF006_g13558 [Phytophthora fragariae]